ncbi:hypothetical protein GH714_029286 [Hevea brasiliensis]|uniref:Uncharacterized protein n=1 Tax=Hevea brasiliensis TaxID=3981 RepID=A0A6A6NJV3_HEVBR|nr:hypothetical protein GH714_029286 [Hevea brasiliensis]
MPGNDEGSKVGGVVGAVAGIAVAVAAVAWGIASIVSDSGSAAPNRKTMKAPGRDYTMFRDDFEKDPAGYFAAYAKSPDELYWLSSALGGH